MPGFLLCHGRLLPVQFYEILQVPLACGKLIRPATGIVKEICNDIRECHVPTLEREKRLIHFRVDADRSSFACTRHSNHFVVTLYKLFAKIGKIPV